MRTEAFRQLYVRSSGGTYYSQAVGVPAGDNAVSLDAVATAAPSGTTSVDLEESNDAENWLPSIGGSTVSLDASNRYKTGLWTGVASRYVRVKASTSGEAFISVGVESSGQ